MRKLIALVLASIASLALDLGTAGTSHAAQGDPYFAVETSKVANGGSCTVYMSWSNFTGTDPITEWAYYGGATAAPLDSRGRLDAPTTTATSAVFSMPSGTNLYLAVASVIDGQVGRPYLSTWTCP